MKDVGEVVTSSSSASEESSDSGGGGVQDGDGAEAGGDGPVAEKNVEGDDEQTGESRMEDP